MCLSQCLVQTKPKPFDPARLLKTLALSCWLLGMAAQACCSSPRADTRTLQT